MTARERWCWALLGAVVLAQIGYPLTAGPTRAHLVMLTVALGFALSVTHAALTRGARTAVILVAVTAGGGLAVESVGVATGLPFGEYAYSGALGRQLLGVPWAIPLAWTWMAWPAWLAAGVLTAPAAAPGRRGGTNAATRPAGRATLGRVCLAGTALAAWDLFLDPQMVAEGYWSWSDPTPALAGVPGVPVGNHLGWLVVALAMMALLGALAPPDRPGHRDGPMVALYLWTWASSMLAHAVFLGLPWSALWGGVGMGLVAVPLVVRLAGRR